MDETMDVINPDDSIHSNDNRNKIHGSIIDSRAPRIINTTDMR